MASQSTGGRPGAAADEPERVFCHACGNTWTKDVRGLVCPRCDSEATEVITAENNPRDFYDVPESPHSDVHDGFRRADTDSDPGEADIEDLGPGSHHFHRHTWGDRAAHDHGPGSGPHDPRRPADLNDGEQVMARFLDLISGLGGARNPPRNRAPPARWPPAPEAHLLGGGGGGPFGGAGNVRTYTSRTGTGFTTFTIATGPINLNAGGGARAGGRAPAEGGQDNDDFNTVFGNLLGGMAPPQGAAAAAAGNDNVHDGGRPNAPNLATSLGQLLSMLVPPGNGQMGDAVYTQEALDRIVSAMMEQNPQSNAAPPASEDAINKLEKKTVDESMLDEADGKAECTICIEELKKGDQVIYLPCKHWFHEECAHLWLREHNTCPICRAAIEAADPAAGNNNSTGGGNAQQGAGPAPGGAPPPFGNSQTPGSASGDYAPPPYPPPGQGGPPMGSGWGASEGPPPVPRGTRPAAAHTWRWSFTYPPRPSMSPNPSADRPGSRTPSGYSINLPRPRRDSLSPPASTSGSRTRQRSPTPNSWERLRDNPQEHPQPYLHRQQQREQQQREQQQQQQSGSGGPLSWLRHQLSRASGSGPATGPGSAPGPGSGPDSRSGDDWARERRREQ